MIHGLDKRLNTMFALKQSKNPIVLDQPIEHIALEHVSLHSGHTVVWQVALICDSR